MELLEKEGDKNDWVEILLKQKEEMADKLKQYSFVHKIYPSDANYLLIKTDSHQNNLQLFGERRCYYPRQIYRSALRRLLKNNHWI